MKFRVPPGLGVWATAGTTNNAIKMIAITNFFMILFSLLM